ncbi:hypothetical protein ANCCEY_11320 [Ancylostoma ceylanicum]|uniref:Uncharacterized protein n=1 Tax=Ancylostoma ceylanicum TaxID=53326 RepID=A0A0D6LI29_9BILA|nr:hypothetical protein ANCCEY_11320 [Ancylostoma ceylanicum]
MGATMIIRIGLLLLYLKYTDAIQVTHVSECGKTRSCWLLPNGCTNATDCSVMITWKHIGRALQVEMEGNDTVLECHFPRKGKGSVHLSHNLKTSNRLLPEVRVPNVLWGCVRCSSLQATEMLLKDSYTELRDGRALCGAEWMLDVTVLDANEKKLMQRISSGKYHLMFAFGNLDADSEKKPHELAGEGAPWRSNDQVRFCNRCPAEILDE